MRISCLVMGEMSLTCGISGTPFLAEFWIVLHFGTIHFSGSSNIIVNGKAKSIERTQRSKFLHKRQDLMPKIHQFRRFLLNI